MNHKMDFAVCPIKGWKKNIGVWISNFQTADNQCHHANHFSSGSDKQFAFISSWMEYANLGTARLNNRLASRLSQSIPEGEKRRSTTTLAHRIVFING